MSWRPRYRCLSQVPRRSRLKRPRQYFHASQWAKLPQAYLMVAISRLSTEEHLAVGPSRALLRSKRLRAVEVYKRRFGEVPRLRRYEAFRSPG